MKGYYIWKDEHVEWSLFCESSSGFCISNGVEAATIFRQAVEVFRALFGDEFLRQRATLSVLHSSEGPIIYRRYKLIFLESVGMDYLEHIYQFSHELCHYMVPREVCKSYRWLEETLCQAMSWYVLQVLFDLRQQRRTDALMPLYDAIPLRLKHLMSNKYPLNNIGLPEYIQRNIHYLMNECYDRKMNRTVAYEILPVLMEYPVLWKIVPFLSELTDTMDLSNAIIFLCRRADIPKIAGDSFIQRLCQQR